MNSIKKFFGIIWMLLGVGTYGILVKTALTQISIKPTTDTIVQWSIFVIIFLPITIGFLIFGWLAFKGAYDNLPSSSDEIV
ncbi:MAG: hypothetical protein CK547_05340 [Chitinophagaceae bacterium]|nr:MAG: hypothetical protein CK547_05340 [Chitinophagaceae bacterium]